MEIVGKYEIMERIESWKGKNVMLLGSGPYMSKHTEISTALIYLFHFGQICVFSSFSGFIL